MLQHTYALACCLILVNSAFLNAQDNEVNLKHLERFVSDQTLMLGQVDIPHLDVAATFDLLKSLKLPVEKELELGRALFTSVKASLLQAGAEKLYLIYNQSGLFAFPLIYVPLKDQAQAEKVASLIAYGQAGAFNKQPSWMSRSETAWKFMDNYLVVGNASSLQALIDSKPAKRPEFHAAMKALKNAPIQVMYLPTPDLRKIVSETMPQLPKELGGRSSDILSKGIQWAVFTANLPPQLQAQLIVETEQPEQAQQLQQLWQTMLASMTKELNIPGKQRVFKVFQLMVSSMPVRVDDRKIILEVSNERFANIIKVLSETLPQASNDELNKSKLRNIVIAMHNFHNDYNKLPNQAICDKEGKPLLSWRVQLLPYLENDNLYKQFKIDEPWDSEHNKKLIDKMPDIYRHPFAKNVPANHTLYQVFYSKKGTKPAAMIMETGKITLGMVTVQDGTSNTMVLTDAAVQAVPWTKPADLLYDGTVENLPKMVSPRGDGWAHAAFGDGSVRRLKPGGKPKILWQLIGRNDGASEDSADVLDDR